MWYTRMLRHDICGSVYPTSRPRDFYIAICYFSPQHSWYASGSESPYMPLYGIITRFSTMGVILLAGDFNARTTKEQSSLYFMDDPMFHELPRDDIGLDRSAQDMGEVNEYGQHFLALGSANDLVIFNDWACWPGSDDLTCWNNKEGSQHFGLLDGFTFK